MKPRLLDLYCGSGGAAMGYHRAGFEVVGIDHKPMPRYPFEFHQTDALEYAAEHGQEFDAIHASPPCQYYTRLRHLPWLNGRVYWRSIPPTREALRATGKPYIIENVEDAAWDMETPAILCGYSLGLSLFRHRCFETWPFSILQPSHRKHDPVLVSGRASLSQRHHGGQGFKEINRSSKGGIARWRLITGIDWMMGVELAQAIPPVYTEFIGKFLLQEVERLRQGAMMLSGSG